MVGRISPRLFRIPATTRTGQSTMVGRISPRELVFGLPAPTRTGQSTMVGRISPLLFGIPATIRTGQSTGVGRISLRLFGKHATIAMRIKRQEKYEKNYSFAPPFCTTSPLARGQKSGEKCLGSKVRCFTYKLIFLTVLKLRNVSQDLKYGRC